MQKNRLAEDTIIMFFDMNRGLGFGKAQSRNLSEEWQFITNGCHMYIRIFMSKDMILLIFFPPAAEPQHEFIEAYQKDFHKLLAKNIAAKFDEKNWLYNTSERFDLFYPSYGDTYPMYNGAVGMTIEQGGIRAGREVTMENGVNLTIKERLTHHKTAV